MKILVTGVAGFIGFSLANKLIETNDDLVGIDNLNNYYDEELKLSRLSILKKKGLNFFKFDISEKLVIESFFAKEKFDVIIHLAAQAGVRNSIDNPHAYIDSNINGFLNILEGARHNNVRHLIYASSSSVYGSNRLTPFSEDHITDEPISLYAASKKSNEIMAQSYSHLYNIPCTGLRFFTVYGPWGRPDMAYFKFVEKILNDQKIDVYGNGKMTRDFTYIDDVVNAMQMLILATPKIKFEDSYKIAPHQIYNIGNNKSENLEKFISIIERELDKKALKNYLDIQLGDVIDTAANITKISQLTNFEPKTSIDEGLPKFIEWYKKFYK